MTSILPVSPILVDDRYDQRVRWTPGERLDHLFEAHVDRLRADGQADRLAVDAEDAVWTFDELDARANRLARHLAGRGVRPGDRVGLLFNRAVQGYVGMLAVLKLNAAYVPLDAGFPPDRIAYICHDAGVRAVVASGALVTTLTMIEATVVDVDADAEVVDGLSAQRLTPDERGEPTSELAYIIYTSGSTGRPKGVAIEHASICNFVRVAAEVYGIVPGDRFYQGMTIAFDFSVEEIWVPWLAGATLVPKPSGAALVGEDLRRFLVDRRVTGLACVPTLLASLDGDVPGLRFLLVSGEACPQDLIARWHRPDRRFLNVYGPTEATVTATWTVLEPDRPVTIGVPLPTYSVVVLDPDSDAVAARGEVGEVCLGGIALSPGYVNRPDLTEKAFIPDPVGLPNNPSGRIYRTGDLGRIDERGDIEYLGRIDLQVKIRGYRIELTEIESVLMEAPGIAAAVVEPHHPEPGLVELAAYYSRRADAAEVDPAAVHQLLRDRLPGYMVPSYFVELDALPMLPSDKVDRKRLPEPPASSRLTASHADYVEPEGAAEIALAGIIAEVLRLDRVSATAHFFDDLGANSLLMARVCARVRDHAGLGAPTMRDVYLHPTLRQLAASLALPVAEAPADEASAPGHRAHPAAYVASGLAQMLVYAAMCAFLGWWFVVLVQWVTGATTPVDVYLRSVGLSAGVLGFLLIVPILVKWLLMGKVRRAKPIRVWGLSYLRFWIVRRALALSPARLTAGTPFFGFYLRLLGARVGPRAQIFSSALPAFPDLLTIGADAVIMRDSSLTCHRAERGIIQPGRVTIGRRAFVGDHAVLDIDTSLGDDAQLGNASALLRGQHVPAGERWHGSPAVPTTADYHTVPPRRRRPVRSFMWGLTALLAPIALLGPILTAVLVELSIMFPEIGQPLLMEEHLPWHEPWVLGVLALATLILTLGSTVVGVAFVCTVPRLLNLLVPPGVVHPLYGIRFAAYRTVRGLTNTPFTAMFGDSNYVTTFLQALGYRLKPVQQTGSNFGMVVNHDNPYLVTIGTGTMVSDGLALMNAEFSSTAFRVRPTVVGRNNFFGNGVTYPPDARVGDNCLLATKVLIPIDGELRHDVGLLGSPPFEIPRSVQRDAAFDDLKEGEVLRRGLRRKLRYNTGTIGWYLVSRWLFGLISSTLFLLAFDLHGAWGFWPFAALFFVMPLVSVAYFVAAEWLTMGFRRQQARYCSLYDPAFWRHERFWKVGSGVGAGLFNGTPFKAWVLRAQGTRVGRQLFDDGGSLVERSLVTIGDHCTLNQGSIIQCHSLEEGTFKSDSVAIGDDCTLGTAAFVHYGTNLGDGVTIEADSFLMKGEQVPDGQRWQGNPATPAGRRPAPDTGADAEASAVSRWSGRRVRSRASARRARHPVA